MVVVVISVIVVVMVEAVVGIVVPVVVKEYQCKIRIGTIALRSVLTNYRNFRSVGIISK